MLPIQEHKWLKMERAWRKSCLKWGRSGLCSWCEIFRVDIFLLKLLFFFGRGGGAVMGTNMKPVPFVWLLCLWGAVCNVRWTCCPSFCICLMHGCPTKGLTWLLLACIPLWLEYINYPLVLFLSARSPVINTCSDLWIKWESDVQLSVMHVFLLKRNIKG